MYYYHIHCSTLVFQNCKERVRKLNMTRLQPLSALSNVIKEIQLARNIHDVNYTCKNLDIIITFSAMEVVLWVALFRLFVCLSASNINQQVMNGLR